MAEIPAQIRATRPTRRYTFPWATGNVDVENQANSSGIGATETGAPVRRNTHPFYVYGDDYGIGPGGWAYVARSQNTIANGPIHRRFGALHQRELQYKEAKLAKLEEELLAIDTHEQENGSPELRSLSPWQMATEGGSIEDLYARKDKLMHEIDQLLESYDRTLFRDIELRKIDLLDRSVVQNLVKNLRRGKVLDDSAMRYFVDIDDFITTKDQSKYIQNPLERLVYSGEGPIHDFIMKPFIVKKKLEGSTYSVHYRSDYMRVTFTIVAVSLILMPLLAPVGIFYFLEPSKPVSVSVVVVFGLAATLMMASVPGNKLDTIFIAMSAYMAVLVTFLANFQGISQCLA